MTVTEIRRQGRGTVPASCGRCGDTAEKIIRQIAALDAELFPGNCWGYESLSACAENEYDFLTAAVCGVAGDAGGSGCEAEGIAGFGLLRCFDDAEVLRIAVRETDRRRGIGRELLSNMIAEAKRRGAGSIFLEVRYGNHAAVELYRKAGFTEEGIRKDYYSDPKEDALIMRYTC